MISQKNPRNFLGPTVIFKSIKDAIKRNKRNGQFVPEDVFKQHSEIVWPLSCKFLVPAEFVNLQISFSKMTRDFR